MSKFSSTVLKWYRKNKRSLPWRDHPDPYAIWVSEIMLQQTRVEAVLPYFERWMQRFPTMAALAESSEHDVLRSWEGLGYYARARNLHKAAKIVVAEYGGRLPKSIDELRKLPGIGGYTAGAIASLVYGLDEPALDGNIRRVLARVFNVSAVADSAEGLSQLWELAQRHLPRGEAGDYNQALMDLGATICIPKNPRCPICPVFGLCEARKLGLQSERPVRKAKNEVPHRIMAAAVIIRGRRVLLALRPSRGLLGGMWEFPNSVVRGAPAKGLSAAVRDAYGVRTECKQPLGVVEHTYSHFTVSMHIFRCTVRGVAKKTGLRWISIEDLADFPMGRIDRQIARKLA